MEIRPARPSDLPAVLELVAQAGLPLDGIAGHIGGFLVAAREGEVVACAGMEVYGSCGLLRSVVVRPDRRGRGLGRALVSALIDRARARGLTHLYLLTTTAAGYFARMGFRPLDRDRVPAQVQASAEFSSDCCAAARAMGLALRDGGEAR